MIFYRTTVGRSFRPEKRGESPEVLVITLYSFWHPIPQDILERKLRQRAVELGFDSGSYRTTVEQEEVESSESKGLGFYRWSIIGPNDRLVERLGPRWIFTPSGEEKFWSYRPREQRKYIVG